MTALRSLFFAIGLGLTACATPLTYGPVETPVEGAGQLDAAQQRGRDFALRRCSGCHAVRSDDGQSSDGPAFHRLARRYNAISLERRFAELAAHGFDRMPPVQMTRSEAEDLIAYLNSLQGV